MPTVMSRVCPEAAAFGTENLVIATSCVLTCTILEVESLRPSTVMTVISTVYSPSAAYRCVAERSVPVAPSPKLHKYDWKAVPPGSTEESKNCTVSKFEGSPGKKKKSASGGGATSRWNCKCPLWPGNRPPT